MKQLDITIEVAVDRLADMHHTRLGGDKAYETRPALRVEMIVASPRYQIGENIRFLWVPWRPKLRRGGDRGYGSDDASVARCEEERRGTLFNEKADRGRSAAHPVPPSSPSVAVAILVLHDLSEQKMDSSVEHESLGVEWASSTRVASERNALAFAEG